MYSVTGKDYINGQVITEKVNAKSAAEALAAFQNKYPRTRVVDLTTA